MSNKCCLAISVSRWSGFHANPNFCVGCFELYLRKIFATQPKKAKKYFTFCGFFFCRMQFCLTQSKTFFIVPFILRLVSFCFFWGGGGNGSFIFVPLKKGPEVPWTPGSWDCSPLLHRHTNVDQLDSGIKVHSTDKHQQANVSDDLGLPVFSKNQFQIRP